MTRGEITSPRVRVDGQELEALPGHKPRPCVSPVRCRCGSDPTIQDQTEIWSDCATGVRFGMTTYYVQCTCGRVAEVASRYKHGRRACRGYGTYDEVANAWNLLQARMARPETGDQR